MTCSDVVVLGAGIAGLAAADRLSAAGARVTVLEMGDRVGGAHRSKTIGPYTFDFGSIFYEAGARLFDLPGAKADMCPTVQRQQRRLTPDGSLRHYPIQPEDVMTWPAGRKLRALRDLLVQRFAVQRDGSLETICRRRLGDTIYRETGLRDYVTRFHHVPADQIDEEFFLHRMAFVAKSTEFAALTRTATRMLRKQDTIPQSRPSLLVRPRSGYGAIFDPIVAALRARGVQFELNTPVTGLSRDTTGTRVETSGGAFRADAVVGAMPLDALHRMLFGVDSGLVSLDLMSLFVSAETLHPETGNVLYNFHSKGRWKRATIYSRIYPTPDIDRAFFTVEVTLPPGASPDPADAFAQTVAHFDDCGLGKDLRLEGHGLLPGAYPLYARGQKARAQAVLDRVTAAAVLPVGRQGRFEYLPTSSGVIRRVAEVLADAPT
ncbi:FAD-dependent oxidoreductase [Jannaschia pohangensis]|uniref:Flavin containing amine oxidoreductase n=1 Tax=Jannaschia pohangensis TaxID=390807 RepID=A0A1I3QVK0_9RHOB|nr:FAD-dependent oxidoreductase [Jannaschia pohangensis]SFJ37136.1 Flavin containing amine oxidoreductase [Jannaschia pohangensis]